MIADDIRAAEKDYGLNSGSSFKVKEGVNKIRVMSFAKPHQGNFKGTKTFKFVGWIFDYNDEKVKLYFWPKSVYEVLGVLQQTEGFDFSDMPMPYDVLITAKDAGTKEVVYQVTGARSNTPVPQTALEQMAEKKPVEEILAKLKENESKGPEASTAEPQIVHSEDVNPLES